MPVKPSQNEEEYFARHESERLRKLSDEHKAHMERQEREQQKALHYMKCPKCGMDLQEIPFGDVVVDKCFNGEGMWLDDGELEKLQEKEAGFVGRMLKAFGV